MHIKALQKKAMTLLSKFPYRKETTGKMGGPMWDECKQVVGMIEEGFYGPR